MYFWSTWVGPLGAWDPRELVAMGHMPLFFNGNPPLIITTVICYNSVINALLLYTVMILVYGHINNMKGLQKCIENEQITVIRMLFTVRALGWKLIFFV